MKKIFLVSSLLLICSMAFGAGVSKNSKRNVAQSGGSLCETSLKTLADWKRDKDNYPEDEQHYASVSLLAASFCYHEQFLKCHAMGLQNSPAALGSCMETLSKGISAVKLEK